MTTDNIITDIRNGKYDNDLNDIVLAINARRKSFTEKTKRGLHVGDRIRFNQATKPLYLRGVEGTITKINRVKVVVDLDSRHNRFYKNINVPVGLIEKV